MMARSPSLAHRTVLRARALLLAADGVAIYEGARRCHTKLGASWRRRFEAEGSPGGPDRQGSGTALVGSRGHGCRRRPRHAARSPDDGSTHWTTRWVAKRLGIGKDTVARIWRDHDLKPWQFDTFKVSNDPDFEDKSSTSSGSTSIPRHGPSSSALTKRPRSRPSTARSRELADEKKGRGTTLTHDYKRHGTTDLFAAMNVTTGEVLYDTKKSHKATDVLGLLQADRPSGAERPRDPRGARQPLCTQGTGWSRRGWTIRRGARWHLHFTPDLLVVAATSSSAGSKNSPSVDSDVACSPPCRSWIDAIELWTEHWNDDPKPSIWYKLGRGDHRQGLVGDGPHSHQSQIRDAPLV